MAKVGLEPRFLESMFWPRFDATAKARLRDRDFLNYDYKSHFKIKKHFGGR